MSDTQDAAILDKRKAHHARHSGRKAERKASKTKHVQELTNKQRNPKAFAFHSVVKAQRKFVRSQDIHTKKHHIPVVDRTPLEPPPVLVAIVGGPKVGKSTLLRCLIKNYTQQRLTDIKGPVTVVTGKKRRLTFVEVNNDINCMIDVAKVADLVLLVMDATFGIEMEIFEFLEICRAHGTPRVMGVLNHIDMMKDNKALKKKKKSLKHRFQVELYPGAKVFYLSGLIRGEYLKNEVRNLGRFISVSKFRPLLWRSTHPYVYVDRWEDLTSSEVVRRNPKCDREVVLYGYVRGTPLLPCQRVHIPGCGDLTIKDINFLPDPCPLPEHQKKRSLNSKERLLYAPMSGVGGVVYDKDAVYIDLGGSHHGRNNMAAASQDSDEEPSDSTTMMDALLDLSKPVDEKLASSNIRLFPDSEPLTQGSGTPVVGEDSDDEVDGDDGEEMAIDESEDNSAVPDIRSARGSLPAYEVITDETGRVRRRAVFDNDNDDDDDTDDSSDDSESDEQEDAEMEESDADSADPELQPLKKRQKKIDLDEDVDHTYSDSDDWNVDADLERLRHSHATLAAPHQGNISLSKPQSTGSCKAKLASSNLQQAAHESVESTSARKRPEQSANVLEKIQNVLKRFTKSSGSAKQAKRSAKSDDAGYSSCSDDCSDAENKLLVSTALPSHSVDNSDNARALQLATQAGELGDGSTGLVAGTSAMGQTDEEENEAFQRDMFREAVENFYRNQSSVSYLRKFIYGDGTKETKETKDSDSESDDELAGLFKRSRVSTLPGQLTYDCKDDLDTSLPTSSSTRDWSSQESHELIKDCFVTGKWKASEDAETLLKMDAEDADLYGDFEDLETGQKFSAEADEEEKEDDAPKSDDDAEGAASKEAPSAREKYLEKKRRLKAMFDAEENGEADYFDTLKSEMNQQAQLNREEFASLGDETRVLYEGFRAGMYVRMQFSAMPCEFVTNFDASYPVIVGGLLDNEQNMGYIRVRIKVHRWYPRILKNRDPLILSLGWRRLQTVMNYAKREDDMKLRALKYARKYLHVEALFWGPVTVTGAGFVALQNVADRVPDFRIAANGVVLETDKSTAIVKKLKLIGYPEKILKKTAFIKDMFHSETEVAKFIGAQLQTQSGIRGIIKKSFGQSGVFRATFEDVIKRSDVVLLKSWAPVEVAKYCRWVRTLLLTAENKSKWSGMKTVYQLKKEGNLKSSPSTDSMYTPITERSRYVPLPLKLPKELQAALPYKTKPKFQEAGAKRHKVVVVKEPHEVKMDEFMSRVKTLMMDKLTADKMKQKEKKKQFQESIKNREAMRQMREKRMKAAICKARGKKARRGHKTR